MVRMSRLNEKFVRKNVAPVGLLVLASGCDVTMLQLMPWEQSRFYEESMGYPCYDLMIVCMVVKTTVLGECDLPDGLCDNEQRLE